MMKLLIINGSPKGDKSNTLRLTNAFVEGIRISEERKGKGIETVKIDVNNSKIEGCKGCFACWKVTPGKCCIDDDMSMVLDKILWADVIVFSFPLYYFNVPGNLKNLIDRQLPMSLPFMSKEDNQIGSGGHDSRYDMSGKKYVLISTCGFYSAKGNYDSVCRMFDHFCGLNNYETVFCGQGELFRVKELSERTDEYLRWVKKAGEEFGEYGKVGKDNKTKLEELLFPREVFEKMADASWGVNKENHKSDNDESLIFTRQMAAMYNAKSYDGKERVLEMCYTDLGKTYQVLLGKDKSEVFTEKKYEATTVIETPFKVWVAIARNEIRGDEALAKQMYRVSGDFSLMMNWGKYFGTSTKDVKETESKDNACNKKRNPNMSIMLTTWITFWVATAINPEVGTVISLAVCAVLPLLMNKQEMIVFDKLSIAMVSILDIMIICGTHCHKSTVLSYLGFGLMWLVSCCFKEPLCAAYVKYGYNGEDALKNPLFMKTNYILAIGWGILYVLISIWTFILNKTDFAQYLIVINNVMPLFMGLFTGWFQKWYPAHIAKGN